MAADTKEPKLNVGLLRKEIKATEKQFREAIHGLIKRSAEGVRENLGRRWTPRMNKGRKYPYKRTGRLQASIGSYVGKRKGGTRRGFVVGFGHTKKVPSEFPWDKQPSEYGPILEWGGTIRAKGGSMPFFNIPHIGGPAVDPRTGKINRGWLPGKRLRGRVRSMGKVLGGTGWYFPVPAELSASSRSMYVTVFRSGQLGGRKQYLFGPEKIAHQVRSFKIPPRPFLRPQARELQDMYEAMSVGYLVSLLDVVFNRTHGRRQVLWMRM